MACVYIDYENLNIHKLVLFFVIYFYNNNGNKVQIHSLKIKKYIKSL